LRNPRAGEQAAAGDRDPAAPRRAHTPDADADNEVRLRWESYASATPRAGGTGSRCWPVRWCRCWKTMSRGFGSGGPASVPRGRGRPVAERSAPQDPRRGNRLRVTAWPGAVTTQGPVQRCPALLSGWQALPNRAMERTGAHDGKERCSGRLQTAEKEFMIVYGQLFARRSLPGR
jgi:hypothetical protein